MKIRSNEELRMFEQALDNCRDAVVLVTPEGKQYDLKTPSGRYQGVTLMLNASGFSEPELFTNCFDDEMVMFDFIRQSRKIA